MKSLKKILDDNKILIDRINRGSEQHIWISDDKIIIKGVDKYNTYIPSKTGSEFHKDDTFIKLIMGAFGSGKTTTCMFDLVMRTCRMPRWYNGRRKARAVIIRNTLGELYSTSLQTWINWFSELGDVQARQKPVLTYNHIFNDGKGLVELEVLFLALDQEKDVRKLKSLEVTFAYLNELSEIQKPVLDILTGRLNGRYPGKGFCSEPYQSLIIADTNPPEEDHWIVKSFDPDFYIPSNPLDKSIKVEKSDNYKIFKQPPGLIKDKDGKWITNSEADNINNLGSRDYYVKMADNQSEEFIRVFCLGQYGTIVQGKVVYPEYNDDIHSVDDIKPIEGELIHIGTDFGLTPASLIIQMTANGQILVLKEYCASDMGIGEFTDNVLLPSIALQFPTNSIGFSEADPSGIAKNEGLNDLSCIGVMNLKGINTSPALSNSLQERLGAVRYFLNKMIDGKPAIIISRKGCPILRRGFIKGYHYRRIAVAGETRYKDEPVKNEYSHPHDGLQYILMKLASDRISKSKHKNIDFQKLWNPVY